MGVLEAGLSPLPVTAYTVTVYSVPGRRFCMFAVDWEPGIVNSLVGLLPPGGADDNINTVCLGGLSHTCDAVGLNHR